MADAAVARSALENILRNTEKNLCSALRAKGCVKHRPKQKTALPHAVKRKLELPPAAVAPAKREYVPPEPRVEPAVPVPAVKARRREPVPGPTLKPEPPKNTPIAPAPSLSPKVDMRSVPVPIPKLMPQIPTIPPEQPKASPPAKVEIPPLASPVEKQASTPAVVPAPLPDSCAADLSRYGVDYAAHAKYEQFGFCEIENPVQVNSMMLSRSKISFPDRPVVACTYAAQMAKFITEQAGPITSAQTSSIIAKWYTGPGFVCRGRNGDSATKLSEHAKGDATDVERIILADGKTLDVKDAGVSTSVNAGVLNAIRHAACGYFTTVLGPGANAAHASHFHLDMEKRGKTGDYRICE